MKHDELEQHFRRLVIGCPGCAEDTCIYCPVPGGDDTVNQLMEHVGQYLDTILADLNSTDQELWTAEQVAHYLGLLDANGARARLSQWKIRSVKTVPHPVTGRPMALYPADEVRAARDEVRAARKARKAARR